MWIKLNIRCAVIILLNLLPVGLVTLKGNYEEKKEINNNGSDKQLNMITIEEGLTIQENDSISYMNALSIDNIIAYESFLKQYQTGKFALKARERLDSLYYMKAQENNNIGDYIYYLDRFPNGHHINEAKSEYYALMKTLKFKVVIFEDAPKGTSTKRDIINTLDQLGVERVADNSLNYDLLMEIWINAHRIKAMKEFGMRFSGRDEDELTKGLKKGDITITCSGSGIGGSISVDYKGKQFFSESFLGNEYPSETSDFNLFFSRPTEVIFSPSKPTEVIFSPSKVIILNPFGYTFSNSNKRFKLIFYRLFGNVEPVIEMLHDEDPFVYNYAAKTLGDIMDKRAIVPLLNKYHGGWVCESVIEALGKYKDKRAVQPLILLLKDRDKRVSSYAAKALGEIKDARAITPLIEMLDDKDVRSSAEIAIKNIGIQSIDTLITGLKKRNSRIRASIAKLLGEFQDERAIEPLIESLKDCIDWEQNSIGDALDKHREKDCIVNALGAIGKPALEPLITTLNDKNLEVREYAAKALGEINDERAVEPLMMMIKKSIFFKEEQPDARCSAAEALGKINDKRAVDLLIDLLKDKKKTVRQFAAVALGKIKDERAVRSLIKALKDDYIASAAAFALGEIKDVRAIQPLVNLLKKDIIYSSDEAAEALIKIGEPAIEPLISVLNYENESVRENLAGRLNKIDNRSHIQLLIAALKNNNDDLRKSAAETLGKLKDKSAVEPLIEALKDEEYMIRKSAAEALGKINDETAVEPLIEALKDEEVRISAAWALGEIKDKRAVEPLTILLRPNPTDVCNSAAEALGKINDKRAVVPLIALLKEDYYKVRFSAAKALGKINDERAVEPLIETLNASLADRHFPEADDLAVAKAVMVSLSKIKDDKAIVALIEVFDRLYFWKHIEIEFLENLLIQIGSQTVDPMIEAIKNTDSAELKKAMWQTLKKILYCTESDPEEKIKSMISILVKHI